MNKYLYIIEFETEEFNSPIAMIFEDEAEADARMEMSVAGGNFIRKLKVSLLTQKVVTQA